MRNRTAALAVAAILASSATMAGAEGSRPTIVLVHGAFAESASWNEVIARLNRDGFRAVALANPLRGVAKDAASVAAAVSAIPGEVVLVGHSYGGPVITEAAVGLSNVKSLVYVAGFAPDAGESSLSLSEKFPGSTLGAALVPVTLADGTVDFYIAAEKFHQQFAADVPDAEAALMAATQRPVTQAALAEPSGEPAWKTLPSYVIYGSDDRNIPAAVMAFMAERAHARRTVVVEGASHALMVSHPAEVAGLIEEAAKRRRPLTPPPNPQRQGEHA